MKIRGNKYTASLFLMLALALAFFSGRKFVAMWNPEQIVPGGGVTEIKQLSDYEPSLEGTAMDPKAYILKGKEPGGTVLILGGTHPNEPAGFLTATLMVENARVETGKLIVVPRTNLSAFTHTQPLEGAPQYFGVETSSGEREFRFGSRLTNPINQWPDPNVYVNASGQQLAGFEIRNLNRCYPGSDSGYLTEKLARGIMNLIERENPDVSFDLHESSPEYPVTNAIVAHEGSMELATLAKMNLAFEDIDMKLERSPANLFGISHREWGNRTNTNPILLETPNPSQGRLRGETDAGLVLDGKDKYYLKAANNDLLYTHYGEDGISIEERVGRHLITIMEILSVYSDTHPDRTISIDDLPGYSTLLSEGLGSYLNEPST